MLWPLSTLNLVGRIYSQGFSFTTPKYRNCTQIYNFSAAPPWSLRLGHVATTWMALFQLELTVSKLGCFCPLETQFFLCHPSQSETWALSYTFSSPSILTSKRRLSPVLFLNRLHTWPHVFISSVIILVHVFLNRMTAVASQQLPILAACNPVSSL